MPLTYSALQALTKDKWMLELIDQVHLATPLLVKLRDKEREWDGGTKIRQPIIYGDLANVGSFTGFDTITYDETCPISAAEFDAKWLVAPVILAETDLSLNQGEQQVIDYVKAKFQVAQETLRKQFTTQLFGDGTGNSGKDITGLKAIVSDSGTYGGIDRSTYTWWRANVNSNSGVSRPLTVRLMRKMFLQCSDGEDKPDLIVTTEAVWNRYAEMVEGALNIVTDDQQKLANLGFQVLNFYGAAVVPDPACDPGYMYFLNTKYLYLRPLRGWNFKNTQWRPSDNKIARKMEILWGGNLTCSFCARQGVIKDIDETGY